MKAPLLVIIYSFKALFVHRNIKTVSLVQPEYEPLYLIMMISFQMLIYFFGAILLKRFSFSWSRWKVSRN